MYPAYSSTPCMCVHACVCVYVSSNARCSLETLEMISLSEKNGARDKPLTKCNGLQADQKWAS